MLEEEEAAVLSGSFQRSDYMTRERGFSSRRLTLGIRYDVRKWVGESARDMVLKRLDGFEDRS